MSVKLNKNLIFTEENFDLPSILNGTSALGLYSTTQFVLRLRDDIKKALDKEELDDEKVQAFSTSMHENIHWWQHIGSNFGFLLSLSYPATSTLLIPWLQKLVSKKILYKSILSYDNKQIGNENIWEMSYILNTYMDIYYAKLFAFDANKYINNIIEDRRFFLNIGHCYHVFWRTSVDSLRDSSGIRHTFLPNIDKWQKSFDKLNENKIIGYFIDSPVNIAPLGIHAIFEGQARFIQLQYLASFFNLNYKYFEDSKMMENVYGKAFNLFLELTKLEKPSEIISNTVALFLLVCDISINPNNGFPLDIYDFENFINKNDPGIRFIKLCMAISSKPTYFTGKINSYSKDEYINLCNELCTLIECKSSYDTIKDVLEWFQDDDIKTLLKEEKNMKYETGSLPLRLLFSKYLRFQEDKYHYPHIFCWLGYHSVASNKGTNLKITNKLFMKHYALFREDYDNEIKAVIFDGYSQENTYNTFNNFYHYNIIFDMIFKWISEDGPFKYDYSWVTKAEKSEVIKSINNSFKQTFNIHPDQINIV